MAWDPTDYKDMLADDAADHYERLKEMLDEEFFSGVYVDEMLRQASKILKNPEVIEDTEFEKLVNKQEADIEDLAHYLMDNYYLTPMGRKRKRMKNMKNENVNEAFDERGLTPKQVKAVHILEDAGLDFVSTPTQIEHGTLMFKDPMLKDVGYSITRRGYARRHIASGASGAPWQRKNRYQLNPKRRGGGFMSAGGTYIVSRILKPGEYVELAEDIKRVVEKYRKANAFSRFKHPKGGPDIRVDDYVKPEDREQFELETESEKPKGKYLKESLSEFLNEDPDFLHDDSSPDDEEPATQEVMTATSSALEELFQQAAENGLTFEMLQDLAEQALDQVDWVKAGQM